MKVKDLIGLISKFPEYKVILTTGVSDAVTNFVDFNNFVVTINHSEKAIHLLAD